MRRLMARSVLIASIAAGTLSGTALGHECFVVSRSDTGDIAAGSDARVWATLGTLEDAMEMHAADGTGVDHVIDWFPELIDIYLDALAH